MQPKEDIQVTSGSEDGTLLFVNDLCEEPQGRN